MVASLLHRTSQLDAAINDYDEAMRLNSQHANARYNRNIALVKSGLLSETIASVTDAIWNWYLPIR